MGASASVANKDMYVRQLSVFVEDEFERIKKLNLTGEELKTELENLIRLKAPERIQVDLADMKLDNSGRVVEVSKKLLPDKCHEHLRSMVNRHSRTFMVCVDGSSNGEVSFALAMSMKKRQDKVLVVHSFNLSEEKALPLHFQRDAIKSRYESLALTSGFNSIEIENIFHLRERSDDESAKDSIVGLIGEYAEVRESGIDEYFLPTRSIDICVLGFSGRRGAERHDEQTVMGSTTDLCLRRVHMPIIIAKRSLPPAPSSLTYVVAVNNTERSKNCVAAILTLIRPRDKVLCIHVARQTQGELGDQGAGEVEIIKSYYSDELRLFGPESSSVEIIPLVDGKTTAQTVVEYVNETCSPPPDFLCIAPRARVEAHEETSSLSSGVIISARCNILFMKSK